MPRTSKAAKPPDLPDLPELLVSQPAQLDACLEKLAAAVTIGFDTEFVGEDAYRPDLCLIQVATAEHLFVIDPLGVGSLDRFWQLLFDPARTTVVHAGREDIRLCFFQAGKPPANVVDVQVAAGLVGLTYPIGYANLVYELLGQRMTKSETLTDWRRRPLLPAQVRYAFDDVRYLLAVWKKLMDRLRRLKRIHWAEEEFASLVRRALGDDEAAAERWRKVKGIGGLDRRGLAIVRGLFEWRDRFAERINRPPRHLLRDDLLAELARRAPTKAEDLAAYRGLPRVEIEPILTAIRTAKGLPLEQCPEPESRDNDPPPIVMLGNLLGVVLADWSARNRIAPNLVASGAELKAIVRSRAYQTPKPNVPLTHGWRAEAVLPDLEAILDGTRTIRVAKPGAPAPLQLISQAGSDPIDEHEPKPNR